MGKHVTIPVQVLQETEKAFLLVLDGKPRSYSNWHPKSEVEIPDLGEIKPVRTARMSEEYARRKGLA